MKPKNSMNLTRAFQNTICIYFYLHPNYANCINSTLKKIMQHKFNAFLIKMTNKTKTEP